MENISNLVAQAIKKAPSEAVEKCSAESYSVSYDCLSNLTAAVLNTSGVGNIAISSLPKVTTFAKEVQRKRHDSLGCPAIPRLWSEMIVPDLLKVTESGEPWLIMDKKVGMSEDDECPKTLGFVSSSEIDTLRDS